MDRPPDLMQPPANPSDPRATVVHVTGDTAALPSIPGYKVIRKLGQGGMATVYMATQVSLDRTVSVKVMESDALTDETSKQRFENEARTIARLSHPNIVAIYEVGRTDDGRMYYTMPYLPNGDLAQRDLGQDEGRVVDLLKTLLSALDYAHARGIVHRDVKQENVLFDDDNRPHLADFGIAISKTDEVRITTAGLAVGSSGYMAPEQARGDAVDARADLYSVGVLAFELLTGHLPFRSNDALALALMHAQKDIPRLPPNLRHWQAFIDKAMAKAPEQRFANAKEMLEALDRIGRRSGNQISQRVMRTIDRTGESGWKKPALFAAVAIVVAGGLFAARGYLPGMGPATPAPAATTSASPAASPESGPNGAVPVPAAPSTGSESAAVPAPPAAPPTSPAAAPSPVSSSPGSAAAAVALGNARNELEHGHLIAPAGKNAVDLSLAAWELAPGTPETRTLVEDVIRSLSVQQAQAIAQRNDQRAAEYQQKATVLDNATVGPTAQAWKSLHASASNAVLARAKRETADLAALSRTQALAGQLGVQMAGVSPPPAVAGPVQPPPAATHPAPTSAAATAAIDPGFVQIHGQVGIYPPAAIAREDVTRRDYAAFVSATHRPTAECNNPKAERSTEVASPAWNQGRGRFGARGGKGRFGRWNHANEASPAEENAGPQPTWSDPGFAQGSDHPVVCVSWSDAKAYTLWLSQRNGHRYRLPSNHEWQLAIAAGVGAAGSASGTVPANSGSPNALGMYGVGGNVAEWLEECALGCNRHQVAGRSWRGRGADLVPAGRMTDRGFDDVGFRVVEVLDK
jgi:serine/threonine protein kinase/formylglycine-generating enzyme required for sulfatase activity